MNTLYLFKEQIEKELKGNILKYWIDYAQDFEHGGFYGLITRGHEIIPRQDKGSVLNARVLWTFSTAYRLYGEEPYLSMADRAFDYIQKHFIDKEYSGVYWQLDYKGNPSDRKNQVYSVAFTIYGLSEYYRATGNTSALALSIDLYQSLEKHARDSLYGGYLEAFARDWSPLTDMSLSSKDMNVPKSMNTHLHIMEAYTNLLRIWDSQALKESLKHILEVTMDHIVDHESWSFKLFFALDWTSQSGITSYGHDIEGSWLIYEAAEVLRDQELLKKAEAIAIRMAKSVLKNGIDTVYGGIYNDRHEAGLDENKDWWPQAEAVVGFYNAFQITGDEVYLKESENAWHFIRKHIIDPAGGEWFWGVTRDGSSCTSEEKASMWKCPYHNGRMCFEMISRIK